MFQKKAHNPNGRPNFVAMATTPPNERCVAQCRVRARLPSRYGLHYVLVYDVGDGREHLALVFGQRLSVASRSLPRVIPGESEQDRVIRGVPTAISDANAEYKPPLVRIHSECFTGETLHSRRCDCGEQLDTAMQRMSADPAGGVIVYLRQEGRGIGLVDKLRAYNLQDLGHDTVAANQLLGHPADARDFSIATAILHDLGIQQCRLLTNNPHKIAAVQSAGIDMVENVPMVPRAWTPSTSSSSGADSSKHSDEMLATENPELDRYLATKVARLGHTLPLPPWLV